MPALKTLERVLSKAGLGSRADARRWIAAGRAYVNGKVERNPDRWVDFARDKVTFDGRPVEPGRRLYVLLYKPTGYITTFKDPQGRPTVYDLLKDLGEWVVPVGRLDLETSGLLLLSNDTQFAERLTNPEYKVAKTYLVKAGGLLDDATLERLRKGVELKDGPTRPAEVRRVRDGARHTFLEITITEGRNRQVRRMLEAVDSKVLKLVRTRIGELEIGELRIGTWRSLTEAEARGLGAEETHQPVSTSDRPNQAQRERNHGPNQRKHSPHGDTHQPKRQQEQPHKRVRDQSYDGQRPT